MVRQLTGDKEQTDRNRVGHAPSEQPSTERMQNGAAGLEPRRLRLLVVDDDVLNRDMMQVMLAPRGYALEFACDGSEALDAIKSRPFDLVFMDLILPDIDGRDVTRQVRQWEAGQRHLPIVAVTAYDMPGQPVELVRAGMDDYIFKPYDLRGLMRIIELYARHEAPGSPEAGAQAALPSAADAPVLDTEGSLLDFSHDVAGYKQILNDFVTSLPARLGRMQQAYAAGDYDRLNRECHTLKGVSAGLGALRLSRLATQLGRSCTDGRLDSAAPLLLEMERAMTEVRDEALTFLES